MSRFRLLSKSEHETRGLGRALGEIMEPAMLVFLTGTLGAGKTRLIQAVASGLGIDAQQVQSPTFTLMTPHSGRLTLVHVDAYRINDLSEVEQLGLDDWLQNGCVMMIEWAERIASVLPKPDLVVAIDHVDDHTRRFHLASETTPGERLLARLKPLHPAEIPRMEQPGR